MYFLISRSTLLIKDFLCTIDDSGLVVNEGAWMYRIILFLGSVGSINDDESTYLDSINTHDYIEEYCIFPNAIKQRK